MTPKRGGFMGSTLAIRRGPDLGRQGLAGPTFRTFSVLTVLVKSDEKVILFPCTGLFRDPQKGVKKVSFWGSGFSLAPRRNDPKLEKPKKSEKSGFSKSSKVLMFRHLRGCQKWVCTLNKVSPECPEWPMFGHQTLF